MANLQEVPVVDVQSDNIIELWPTLLLAVQSSTFIAIDTELSGLGNRRQLNAKDMDERYQALSNISKTRSIISVGLSCFKQQDSAHTGLSYVSQTFNILMLCSEEYVVEPLSLRFLVNHNFDFNRQYAKGIPYYRGPDQEKVKERQWLRELLVEIMSHKVPVVFHNAFVDLGFLYQSFHTTMPASMGSFLADLSEVFVGGVFDTKYIAEFKARFAASYLEYVFRKCQRDNQGLCAAGSPHVSISTLTYPSRCTYITYLPCSIVTSTTNRTSICMTYAGHGWCAQGINCTQSHDISMILDADERNQPGYKRRKRKRRAKQDATNGEIQKPGDDTTIDNVETIEQKEPKELIDEHSVSEDGDPMQSDATNEQEPMNVSMEEVDEEEAAAAAAIPKVEDNRDQETSTQNRSRTEGHRAGFDSFMTGFIFAHFVNKFRTIGAGSGDPPHLGMPDFLNKVSLGGKDIPLNVVRGNFVKTSKEHRLKMDKL